MEEIEEEDYLKTLEGLIRKKADQMTNPYSFQNKQKLAAFVIRKGYESNLVWEVLKNH